MVLPPQLGFNSEIFASNLASSELKRSFDVSSRVAALIGHALAFTIDPQTVQLTGLMYSDAYGNLEKLVNDLMCNAKTGPDSYIYCESTTLALS